MTTSTISWLEEYIQNLTIMNDTSYTDTTEISIPSNPFSNFPTNWILRLSCLIVIVINPWANYQLIRFLQTRPFYTASSAKWYLIFKASFDTIYVLLSLPIMFLFTFDIDIVHKNSFTCKFASYVHYVFDDLISIMLTLLCIDRMLRITCHCRLRTRFSLTICIITICFFTIINIHHIIRLKHRGEFCMKDNLGIWDYTFDILYSFIYTSITWTIIFIASINLTISVYCDRTRRNQLKKQQQQEENKSKISFTGNEPIGFDSDRIELIHSTDDWEDPTVITIEQHNSENRFLEQEQQDNIDLQITICVLITSAIFLVCNLPNFIMFVIGYVFKTFLSSPSQAIFYLAFFPLLIAHTVTYFVFNHLAARIFPNNLS